MILRLQVLVPALIMPVLMAQVDSGGGISALGYGTNHSSIGSPIETTGTASGLIDILYPASTVDPAADADGNGLPDVWETQNFGATGVTTNADADGDGTSNLMEYLAGTNPVSATSVFRPSSRLEGGSLILSVPTVGNRNYRVWGTANLQTGWGAQPLDTISGDGSTIEWSYLMSQSPTGRYFLRIEIVIPN
jgi:hypothetical protein